MMLLDEMFSEYSISTSDVSYENLFQGMCEGFREVKVTDPVMMDYLDCMGCGKDD